MLHGASHTGKERQVRTHLLGISFPKRHRDTQFLLVMSGALCAPYEVACSRTCQRSEMTVHVQESLRREHGRHAEGGEARAR